VAACLSGSMQQSSWSVQLSLLHTYCITPNEYAGGRVCITSSITCRTPYHGYFGPLRRLALSRVRISKVKMPANQPRTSCGLLSRCQRVRNIPDEIRFHLRMVHEDASTAICFPPFSACPYESVAGSLTWISLNILSAENMCRSMPNDSPHQRIMQTRSLH
jgi:hypothetical protein